MSTKPDEKNSALLDSAADDADIAESHNVNHDHDGDNKMSTEDEHEEVSIIDR